MGDCLAEGRWRGFTLGTARRWALALGVALGVGACEPLGGTVGGANPWQSPIITRFEVFPNAQNPGTGPFEIVAHAAGEGTLEFTWSATGGLLSAATQSVQASTLAPVPVFSAWQPPRAMGTYEVSLVVTDATRRTYRRVARFEVEREVTRIVAPRPAQAYRPLAGPSQTVSNQE